MRTSNGGVEMNGGILRNFRLNLLLVVIGTICFLLFFPHEESIEDEEQKIPSSFRIVGQSAGKKSTGTKIAEYDDTQEERESSETVVESDDQMFHWSSLVMDERRRQQIQSYRDGKGLLLNFHITHQAGTALCVWAQSNGPTPSSSCMNGDEFPTELKDATKFTPWTVEETSEYVPALRKHFHYISWEYGMGKLKRSVNATDWEHPDLVSIIIMRNPLDRLLAGDGNNKKILSGNATIDEWWAYAKGKTTDNFALRTITSNEGCCDGSSTSEEYLALAKAYLSRFTIIIDQECYDESLDVLTSMLNLTREATWYDKFHARQVPKPPVRERIDNDSIYSYLVNRNAKDIALYEWAANKSLVKCNRTYPIVDMTNLPSPDNFDMESTPPSNHQGSSDSINLLSRYPSIKKQQIQNYVNGTGLIVNFHITHHAGTSMCFWAREFGPSPTFNCMGTTDVPEHLWTAMTLKPWNTTETDTNVEAIRPYFHFVSWEFGLKQLPRSVNETNWENPNLLSIIVMRNPMDRLLSDVPSHHVKNGTAEEWWNYANDVRTDNYALHTIMSKEGCCNGPDTSEDYLERAKSYLERFTLIIDQECLGESLEVLSNLLNVTVDKKWFRSKSHKPAIRRIKNDTLYSYLVNRNAKDMALYEWAAGKSLVKCNRKYPIVDRTTLDLPFAQSNSQDTKSIDNMLPGYPSIKKEQIQNYVDGTGLILNFHITHHAGTSMCKWAREFGPSPTFNCMGTKDVPEHLWTSANLIPWTDTETDSYVKAIRPYFHFVAWEFDVRKLQRSVNETNWENPNLLSIIVMRNPMDRIFSDIPRHHVKNGTADEWWEYANHIGTNNYALRTIMSKEGCCNGSSTSDDYLERAKSYLERFTLIIDQECFGESIEVLSSLLNVTVNERWFRTNKYVPARERIGNDTLYSYLVNRNAKDIALYEWAASKSLVKCNRSSPIVNLTGLVLDDQPTKDVKRNFDIQSQIMVNYPSHKKEQVKNYLDGKALMLNFHVTHHGGTALCQWALSNGPAPSFACMSQANATGEIEEALKAHPWTANETDMFVPIIRDQFHFLSWEFGTGALKRSINETNWEHPNIVSIIVMRNPLERLLAGDGKTQWMENGNATAQLWWDYSNGMQTDNFALRTITSKEGCCNGSSTSEEYLDLAKSYLSRFTFIIDQECLDDSLEALSNLLNLTRVATLYDRSRAHQLPKPPVRERINNDTLYSYLVDRNTKDIALYEWAASKSLVKCNRSSPIVNLTGLVLDDQSAKDVKRNLDIQSQIMVNYPSHKKEQVKNYLDGKALMLNFHVTHHGGTALCQWALSNGPAPSFACMSQANATGEIEEALKAHPWTANETDMFVPIIRDQFHFLSWEFGTGALKRSINETNWEHPNIVSIIVMRNPLERLLSDVPTHHVKNGTADEWWEYANHVGTNNFALRTITSKEGCCNGSSTSEEYLDLAKSYLSRFTFIIDQECLDDSLEALSNLLNLTHQATWYDNFHARQLPKPPVRERINNDTLYSYLVDRNTKDIALYEWAASKSLVKCNRSSPIVNLTGLVLDDQPTKDVKRNFDIQSQIMVNYPSHKKEQVKNYLDGKALMLNFHVTHHGGTALCQWALSNGPAPSFACMSQANATGEIEEALKAHPWTANETDMFVPIIRDQFHFLSWEFGTGALKRSINETNWEHPNIVSIIVMRNPLERLLSDVPTHHVKNGTADEWWEYANHVGTNNFALRTITSKEGCCNGSSTSEEYLDLAKSYLSRFTFIIDQECLDDSLEALSNLLNLTHQATWYDNFHARQLPKPPVRERINNDTLYSYLVDRNTKDIALYEWAASKSLVKCNRSSPIVNLTGLVLDDQPTKDVKRNFDIQSQIMVNYPSHKKEQVKNYLDGKALMLNFHVTHHGGTALCQWALSNGPAPSFACMSQANATGEIEEALKAHPWTANETDMFVPIIRDQFHFLSWEFGTGALKRSINETNWEHPSIVSIIVMRNPLERLLAGDGKTQWMENGNATAQLWWDYSNGMQTDNFALRTITSKEGCCNGSSTSEEYLDLAKSYLSRFTFIIDQECLDDSLEALSNLLNLTRVATLYDRSRAHQLPKPPVRERINNDTLYSYLVDRNTKDIALYEWAASKSLVKCKRRFPVVDNTRLQMF